MLRYLGILLTVVAFVLLPMGAWAATTSDVEVTATPAYVTISNTPSTYGFGTVAASSNTSTTINYFTITNGSTVNINIAVGTNNTVWAGGVTWAHSDTGTAGADQAALYATPNDTSWATIVKNASQNNLYANTGTATLYWGLRLVAPTSFTDGVAKSIITRLTATAA